MATVGPRGAFRRITVHYSSAGDEANDDDFLEFVMDDVLDQETLYQSIMGARTPGASVCPHHFHGESSSSGGGSSSRETSRVSAEQIAADFEYARRLQEEMEDLTIGTPADNDEQDDISCVPSPSDTDDDDHGDHDEEAARQDDDSDDDDVDPDNMTYEQRQELVESVGNESRGLSDELMRYLVPWKYKSGSGFFSRKTNHHHDDCSVCLSAFRNRERLITLPCNHIYHDGCITRWLKIDKTCPVCKYEVFGPS